MTNKKDLEKLAREIAELEKQIQKNENKEIVSVAEAKIQNLVNSQDKLTLEDIMILDEMIQGILI